MKAAILFVLALACFDASASVILEAGIGKNRLLLHDTVGPCQNGARFAEDVDHALKRTGGCYVMQANGRIVQVAFFDGEVALVPLDQFKPSKGT